MELPRALVKQIERRAIRQMLESQHAVALLDDFACESRIYFGNTTRMFIAIGSEHFAAHLRIKRHIRSGLVGVAERFQVTHHGRSFIAAGFCRASSVMPCGPAVR